VATARTSRRTPALLHHFTRAAHTREPLCLPFGHPRATHTREPLRRPFGHPHPSTSSASMHAGLHAHSPPLSVPGASTTPQQLPFHAPGTTRAVPLPPSPSAFPRTFTMPQQLQQAAAIGGSRYNMYNSKFTFTTPRSNTCNIHPKQLKHLQDTSETLEKHVCSH
jgi:hypothetical protein